MNVLPFNRIVTFGCSHTYGHGLADCYLLPSCQPGPTPSKFAWPELLSQEFNLEVVNMSKSAASNIEILSRILAFDFIETDLVVIQWTYTPRDLIFNINNNYQIGPAFPEDKKNPNLIKSYYMIHNKYDSIIRSLLHIHHADMFKKNKKVQSLNYIHEIEMDNINIWKNSSRFNWFDIPIQPFLLTSLEIDKAVDGHHAGPKTQIEVSKTIISLIKEKYEQH
jgi:hypothetical protein